MFSIYKRYTLFCIWQNTPWQSSGYNSGSKYPRIVNIAEFLICKSYRVLNMPQNGGIWLNMVECVWIGGEYAWIYNNRQDSEYANVLNTFHATHSLRSLYKLMSTYGDMGVFRRMSKIYDFGKITAFNNFCKTLHPKSLRDLWIYVRY